MRKAGILIFICLLSYTVFSQNYNIDWRKCFGSAAFDDGNDLIKTSDGYLLLNVWAQQQIWLIKTDFSGTQMWDKKYGGSYNDYAYKIVEMPDHNYMIAASSQSSDGDISNDPYPGSTDYWFLKVNSLGNKIWDRIYGGTGEDVIYDACASPDGGIVALGYTTSCDGDVDTCYGLYDFWILKLDSNGNKVWSTVIGGAYFEEPHVIISTSDGGYLAGGLTDPEYSINGNITCQNENESWDGALFKLDSSGVIEWQQCYGGSETDGLTAIIELEDGYLLGGFGSSIDGDLINSGYHLGYYGTGDRTPDTWIIKTDLSGNIIWQKCYGGSEAEFPRRIFITELGYRVFNYSYSFDGDVTGNNSLNSWYSDIWTFEIDSAGNLLSNQCFGHNAYEELKFGVIKNSDYQYVVLGHTTSAEWDCNYDFDITLFQITDTLLDAVGENEMIKVIETYPVPSTEFVTFKLKMPGIAKFEVFDCLGIKQDEFEINDNTYTMSVSHKPSGLYLYKFIQNSRMYCGKFVVER